MIDQGDKGHLGGICYVREHGFTEERFSQGHAIKPTDQGIILPGFNRKRIPGCMQLALGLDHIGHNPGTFTDFAWDSGALVNHLIKSLVYGYIEKAFFDGFLQGPGYAYFIRIKYQARVRRPPHDWFGFCKPWENSHTVSLQKALLAQITADSQKSFSGGEIGRRK